MSMEQTTYLVWGFPIARADVDRVREMVDAKTIQGVDVFDVGELNAENDNAVVGVMIKCLAQGRYETIGGPVCLETLTPRRGPDPEIASKVRDAINALAVPCDLLADAEAWWWIVGCVS